MGKIEPVTISSIEAAAARIRSLVPPTPVLQSAFLAGQTGHNIFLKLENLNLSGSFKIRGATNALLSCDRNQLKEKGVIAASAGNHAQGVARVAMQLDVPAHIFMPERTPIIKAERTKDLGAKITLVGRNYDEAYQQAVEEQKKTGAVMIHPYANHHIISGQGTIGLELLEQLPNLGMVVVPVGGGGLIGGVACAIKEKNPNTIVIGAQAAAYPALQLSYKAGKIVDAPFRPTIADGIAVKGVDQFNLDMIRKYVDDIVLVDEEELAWGVMTLMERCALLVEGSGGATAAALSKIDKKYWDACGVENPVACIVSGGNIDVNLLGRITAKGLIKSGRLMRLRVTLEDRPGMLSEFLAHIRTAKANIHEIHHDRTFSAPDFHEVMVDADIETSNREHQKRVESVLDAAKIKFSVLT